MKINIKGLFKAGLLITLSLSTLSCKKMFDLEPEDALGYDQAYQNVYDADAAVMGIYGKVMGIADRYLVLNELRADLEDVTQNSDKYLKQINEHNVTTDNPWADPKPWYEIIINCNDVLENFDIMLANKRLSQDDYNVRSSEIITLRSWLYLQLGVQYGTVPYITSSLANIDDLKDESKFPKISFDQLIDNLIQSTESMANKDHLPAGVSLNSTLDSYPTLKMFINKYYLMGDLYLWKGNYPMAAKYYHKLMAYAQVLYPGNPADEKAYNTYTLGMASNSGTTFIGNERWSNIFTAGYSDRYATEETITLLPFDKKFSPANPFIDLYYEKYLIKPSAKAIKNWNDQTRSDNTPFDTFRGLGKSYDYKGGNTNPVIKKQIATYNPLTPFETGTKWVVYRAALLHLHMAEAANRDGRDRLAYALMNLGVRNAYTPASGAPSNVTNVQQSNVYRNSANEIVPDPNPDYYFDARQGDAPRYRNPWFQNGGVRGRVSLGAIKVDSAQYFDMSIPGREFKPVTNRQGLTIAMENLLINESALEMAFEGNRWPDLLRIALRWEKENPGSGKEFLKNKITAKFVTAGVPVPEGVNKLGTDVSSWYLPFKWK